MGFDCSVRLLNFFIIVRVKNIYNHSYDGNQVTNAKSCRGTMETGLFLTAQADLER